MYIFLCESESELGSSLLFFDSCSRLWDNRANGGDICGVANGPPFVFTQVSSFSLVHARQLVFFIQSIICLLTVRSNLTPH
jgi:hypothetical protein